MKAIVFLAFLCILGCVLATDCEFFTQACFFPEGEFALVTGHETDHNVLLNPGKSHYFEFSALDLVYNEFKICAIEGAVSVTISNKGSDPKLEHIRSVEVSACKYIDLGKNEADGQVTVMVENTSETDDVVYTLFRSEAKDIIPLSSNSPSNGNLLTDNSKTYAFQVLKSRKTTIEVITEKGFARVGTSLKVVKRFEECDKTSSNPGENVIVYNRNEFSTMDIIFITVDAPRFDTNYKISVVVDNVIVSLVPSISSHFISARNEYFKFLVTKIEDVSVHIALECEANIYIRLNEPGHGTLPSKWNSKIKREGVQGGQLFSIKSNILPAIGGHIDVLVQGHGHCEGYITGTYDDEAMLLNEGQSIEMTKTDENWRYFEVSSDNVTDNELKLVVSSDTSISSVYVDCSFDPSHDIPSRSHYILKSEKSEYHTIMLKSKTKQVCEGSYFVAVRSQGQYSILYLDSRNVHFLNGSESALYAITGNSTQTFFCDINEESKISIEGPGVKLFYKYGTVPPKGFDDLWTMSPASITTRIGEKSVFLVVKSFIVSEAYFELVFDSASPTNLIAQTSAISNVKANHYKYFKFELSEDTPLLKFSVNSFYGSAHMYISNIRTLPTMLGYNEHIPGRGFWASDDMFFTSNYDEIVIENVQMGTYNTYIIGVISNNEDAGFEIIVESGEKFIQPIVVGSPFGVKMDANSVQYIQVNVESMAMKRNLQFVLSDVTCDTVFTIKKCTNADCQSAMQKKNADWKSEALSVPYAQSVFLEASHLKNVKMVLVTITTTPNCQIQGHFGVFDSKFHSYLPLDINTAFSLMPGSSQVFKTHLPLNQGNTVTVTTNSTGTMIVEPYWNGQKGAPLQFNNVYKTRDIQIEEGVEYLFLNCTSVGKKVETSMMIEMRENEVTPLTIEEVHSESFENDGRRTFSIDIENIKHDIQIGVSQFSSFPLIPALFDIFVSININPKQPRIEYDYTQYLTHSNTLVIAQDDDKFENLCTSGCSLYINIYPINKAPFAYNILVERIPDTIVLTPNSSITQYISPTQSRYFEFKMDDAKSRVTIEVDTISGYSDICVSTTRSYSGCLYSLKDRQQASQKISFIPDSFSWSEKKRTYFIGISRSRNSARVVEFKINLDIKELAIRPLWLGEPLNDVIKAGSHYMYSVTTYKIYTIDSLSIHSHNDDDDDDDGHTSMFIGYDEETSPEKYQWSQVGDGTLQTEQCYSRSCSYFVYVECVGNEDCMFEIELHADFPTNNEVMRDVSSQSNSKSKTSKYVIYVGTVIGLLLPATVFAFLWFKKHGKKENNECINLDV